METKAFIQNFVVFDNFGSLVPIYYVWLGRLATCFLSFSFALTPNALCLGAPRFQFLLGEKAFQT